MADSSTTRAQRSRLHKRGDHSLCLPGRCSSATPDVSDDDVRDAATEKGPELGSSGSWLWREMTNDGFPPPMQRLLLLEACRIADRLDRLDAQLNGESWLRFLANDEGTEVTVVVDRVLAEARQQATALKQLVAEYRQAGAKPSTRGRSTTSNSKGAGLADITALIEKRRAAASD